MRREWASLKMWVGAFWRKVELNLNLGGYSSVVGGAGRRGLLRARWATVGNLHVFCWDCGKWAGDLQPRGVACCGLLSWARVAAAVAVAWVRDGGLNTQGGDIQAGEEMVGGSSGDGVLLAWWWAECVRKKKAELKKFQLDRLAGWWLPRWEELAGFWGRTKAQVRSQVSHGSPDRVAKEKMVHENGAQRTGQCWVAIWESFAFGWSLQPKEPKAPRRLKCFFLATVCSGS